jgi:hypothetical protein
MIQDSSLKAYYSIQSSLGARQKQVFVALSGVPGRNESGIDGDDGIEN